MSQLHSTAKTALRGKNRTILAVFLSAFAIILLAVVGPNKSFAEEVGQVGGGGRGLSCEQAEQLIAPRLQFIRENQGFLYGFLAELTDLEARGNTLLRRLGPPCPPWEQLVELEEAYRRFNEEFAELATRMETLRDHVVAERNIADEIAHLVEDLDCRNRLENEIQDVAREFWNLYNDTLRLNEVRLRIGWNVQFEIETRLAACRRQRISEAVYV